jgi:hypothetical protein
VFLAKKKKCFLISYQILSVYIVLYKCLKSFIFFSVENDKFCIIFLFMFLVNFFSKVLTNITMLLEFILCKQFTANSNM